MLHNGFGNICSQLTTITRGNLINRNARLERLTTFLITAQASQVCFKTQNFNCFLLLDAKMNHANIRTIKEAKFGKLDFFITKLPKTFDWIRDRCTSFLTLSWRFLLLFLQNFNCCLQPMQKCKVTLVIGNSEILFTALAWFWTKAF